MKGTIFAVVIVQYYYVILSYFHMCDADVDVVLHLVGIVDVVLSVVDVIFMLVMLSFMLT